MPLEVPTVARDIIYGWARGLVGTFFQDLFAPELFSHKACPTESGWRQETRGPKKKGHRKRDTYQNEN